MLFYILQLRIGYSQLAFNRPGFACSTGTPWPQIDANAVASVIDFATKVCYVCRGFSYCSFTLITYGGVVTSALLFCSRFVCLQALGWQPHNIMMYAWSIGGYTAGRALLAHPDISGAVLDATFDHVLPLAVGRMPRIIGITTFLYLRFLSLSRISIYTCIYIHVYICMYIYIYIFIY